MRITKCDICEKTINPKTGSIYLSCDNIFAGFEICSNCGKPITKYLKSKKLVKPENKKNGRKK